LARSIPKEPSASINPISQFGSMILVDSIFGLFTGEISVKDKLQISVKPLFIEALILTIFFKPSIVKCSFLFIKHIADLNKRKSAFF